MLFNYRTSKDDNPLPLLLISKIRWNSPKLIKYIVNINSVQYQYTS